MMQPNTWQRFESLFHEALEIPAEQRSAFLNQACRDDPTMRAELEAVIAAHFAAGGTTDPDHLVTGFPGRGTPGALAGRRVGAYRLEELIGQGGMGEVYRATRIDDQYSQQVAIKLVRPGQGTDELRRRFRLERQILARLEHPNIATLLDGGVTDSGQPYLVMQYVDGSPITTYAADNQLGLDQRLVLFETVCDAVRFAHANLIVHRDLKPSNILVTKHGEVRLLDFGIAKLIDADGASLAPSTTGELLLLTPEHAAPEQFLGGAITTATDEYALGVLLYELLVGFRPFQFVPAIDLHRAVCERDPSPPSVASRDPESRAKVGATAPVPPAQLAGDLDSIVLKALRKEPERRYGSVADLRDDLERHRAGFPVEARPETFGYLAGRFLRRHRVGVAAAAALAAALVTVAVVSVRSAATIKRERDVAVQVSTFLEDLFKAPDPYASSADRRDTLRIRAFLDQGAAKVDKELTNQPLLQARLLSVLGKAYRNLGQQESARPLLEHAVAIRHREIPADPAATASSETDLGLVLLDLGKYPEAKALFQKSVAALALDSVGQGPARILALNALGNVLVAEGKFAEAEAWYRQAVATAEAEYGPTDQRVAESLTNLAHALARQAKLDAAEPLLRRALGLQRAALGNDHPEVATVAEILGNALSDLGRHEEALRLLRECLAIRRARLPSPHPQIAVAINNVAAALQTKGDFATAEPLLRETVAMRRAVFGPKHPGVATGLLNWGLSLLRLGRTDEADSLFLEARLLLIQTVGPDHPLVASADGNLSGVAHERNDHRKALTYLNEALVIRRAKLPPDHPIIGSTLSDIGRCLTELRRYPEAETQLLEAYRILVPRRKDEAKRWDNLLDRLAKLYHAQGRDADAARYTAERTSPDSTMSKSPGKRRIQR